MLADSGNQHRQKRTPLTFTRRTEFPLPRFAPPWFKRLRFVAPYLYIYIYIYVEREREIELDRWIDIDIDIDIYTYVYIYIYIERERCIY